MSRTPSRLLVKPGVLAPSCQPTKHLMIRSGTSDRVLIALDAFEVISGVLRTPPPDMFRECSK